MLDTMTAEPRCADTRPPTVAVVCSYTFSLVNFRYRLLETMVDRGCRVIAFGPEDDRPTIEKLKRIGVEFRRVPMSRAGLNPVADFRTLAALHSAFRQTAPDVVLCYTTKPIIYGLTAARLAGVPHRHALVTGLGYIFGDGSATPRRRVLRAVATSLYRVALKGTGRVFVYNDADETDILRSGLVSDRGRIVRVAGSGIDLEHFPASPVSGDGTVFLMVARLLRDKGVYEFAEAAKRLRRDYPNARFQLLGRPDPGPTGIPVDQVEAWQREATIDYLGETDDVRPCLAAASVFVLPSFYREGIPRSILEAMATGRPVVTTNLPGCRDTVVEGENGFCTPPRDVDALVGAMRRFLDDPALAARMGRRSRQLAVERFDVEAVNRRLLEAMDIPAPGDA